VQAEAKLVGAGIDLVKIAADNLITHLDLVLATVARWSSPMSARHTQSSTKQRATLVSVWHAASSSSSPFSQARRGVGMAIVVLVGLEGRSNDGLATTLDSRAASRATFRSRADRRPAWPARRR
jgi:hypothetical protein